MYLEYIDIFLFLILLGFVYNGISKGFIKLLGRIVALVLGIILTSHLYIPIYLFLNQFFSLNESIAKISIFILTYIILNRIINWLFVLIEKVYKLLSIIPFTKFINKLLGAILGLLEGLLILSIIVHLFKSFNLFHQTIKDSLISPALLWFVEIILPILPSSIKFVQQIYGVN
jgi:membrane protein required for colicin V production